MELKEQKDKEQLATKTKLEEIDKNNAEAMIKFACADSEKVISKKITF